MRRVQPGTWVYNAWIKLIGKQKQKSNDKQTNGKTVTKKVNG